MELAGETKLGKLIDEYPFLVEFLASYAPKFKAIQNPILRRTVARGATLKQVASVGEVALDELLAALAAEIAKRRGEKVSVATAAGGESQAAAPLSKSEALKEILADLHRGVPVDEVKERFAALISEVGASEIAAVEQQLVAEGLPPEEIKRLCDVHVEVFKQALAKQAPVKAGKGHPVHTYLLENEALGKVVAAAREILRDIGSPPDAAKFAAKRGELEKLFGQLWEVNKHYVRKENQLFPFLEKHDITAPPKVMWSVHDDIRALFKKVNAALAAGDAEAAARDGSSLLQAVADMFYKEEHILFPMAMETLTAEEWAQARAGEAEIGYALVAAPPPWPSAPAEAPAVAAAPPQPTTAGEIPLDTGALPAEVLNLILKNLPIDLTFVDENDVVRYYSATADRIFPRSPGVIGRKVQNCHPPASLDRVERILRAFRDGTKDVAEFWLRSGERFVHIRYFAIRDAAGRYRGTLEVTQDIAPLRALAGERRLLDW